jgi:hypothetical protein
VRPTITEFDFRRLHRRASMGGCGCRFAMAEMPHRSLPRLSFPAEPADRQARGREPSNHRRIRRSSVSVYWAPFPRPACGRSRRG